MNCRAMCLAAVLASVVPLDSDAGVTVFFDNAQVATLVATGTTSDTISSLGYEFTYTRDKLFTGGVGLTNPVGRFVTINWPTGVQAQAVTAGPTPGKAVITLRRVDGTLFSLTSFTAHLLANTAGAGANIEIMPVLNGEDALNDPLYFNASGYAGSEFSYDTSPNYLGSTAALTNYEAYKIVLYVDYALVALTLEGGNQAPMNIALSNAAVPENEPAGTVVGTFATTDPDSGDTFTYAMAAGAGDADNALFAIDGNVLQTAASFNYEARSNYSIRVQSTDPGLLSTQKTFRVDVIDVDERPAFAAMDPPDGSGVVITWSSLSNCTYTICWSTNLVEGFVPLASNLAATPLVNAYTVSVEGIPAGYWMVTMQE